MDSKGKKMAEKPGLFLIDDDPLIVDSLNYMLQDEFRVHAADSRKKAKELLRCLDPVPSLALVDLGLPPNPHAPDEGFQLINEMLAFNRTMKILVLSGQNKPANIKHALTLGAVDFVPKPCDVELLKSRLKHQLMILEAEHADTADVSDGEDLLGGSASVKTLRSLIQQFADTPFPVLIEGESGSGKELVARHLHFHSERATHPFLTINCAAFPAELLEAQLFGHAKGAFTGADVKRHGFFEEAGQGTLFLDEVGEMPLELQTKLLRVLENGDFYRIGETQPRQSRARILAATNRDLPSAVRAGTFRQDLYHRLSVLTINVPPLRERGDDWKILFEHFRALYAGSVAPFALDQEAETLLSGYGFPGNIRELRNIVIRLGAKYPNRTVNARQMEAEMEMGDLDNAELPALDLDRTVEQELSSGDFRLDATMNDWERRYIVAALKRGGGNLSKTARLLGINRTTLYSKMQRLHIEGC